MYIRWKMGSLPGCIDHNSNDLSLHLLTVDLDEVISMYELVKVVLLISLPIYIFYSNHSSITKSLRRH